LTGLAALDSVRKAQIALNRIASVLKTPADQVADRVEAIAKEIRELRKKVAAGPKTEGVGVDQLLDQAVDIGGVKVIVAEVPGAGMNDLRQMIDLLRRKNLPLAIFLGNAQAEEKKVTLIAAMTRELVEKGFDAVAWIRGVAGIVGGSGGGRPDMAQAGGKIPEKLHEAFASAKQAIEKILAKK
jgi:alanyl-tRNA synthetase